MGGSSTNSACRCDSWPSPWHRIGRCGSFSRTSSAAASAARRTRTARACGRRRPRPAAAISSSWAGPIPSRPGGGRCRATYRIACAVVERRADIDPAPRLGVVGEVGFGRRWSRDASPGDLRRPTRRVDALGRASPIEVATAVKSPPSFRVAEVKTTVLSASSLSRSCPHTCSGATHSWCRRAVGRARPATARRRPRGPPSARRTAHLVDHALGLLSGRVGLALASTPWETHWPATGPRRAPAPSASARASGSTSNRPGSSSSMAARNASAASGRSPAGSPPSTEVASGSAGGPLDLEAPTARRWPPG